MSFCLVSERESVTRNRNMLAFTGHVQPVCPCSGKLFCPTTEWNSVARNGNMSIPGGHVLFVHLVTERILSQGLCTNT